MTEVDFTDTLLRSRLRDLFTGLTTEHPDVQTQTIVQEVAKERYRQRHIGYDRQHDDAEGVAHLMQEAHYRLGHMGEVSSPAAVRAELLKVAALAVAGIETIDRAKEA